MDDTGTSACGTVVACDILAQRTVRANAETIQHWRRRPGPGAGERLSHNLLKHADEQTVVSVAAVLETIQRSHLETLDFSLWGVVAAPSFLGRTTLVGAIKRYESEGAWGISPHFIPHRSQHAVSGTISQVLKIHGPNFGAGGAPGGHVDALLAAAVLLEDGRLPGVWVVFSDWEPEVIPDETGGGQSPSDASCWATALALVPAQPEWHGLRLCITAGGSAGPGAPAQPAGSSAPGVGTLLGVLKNCDPIPTTAVWQLEGLGRIELKRPGGGIRAPKYQLRELLAGRNGAGVEHQGAGTENQW